jgi:prolipoprotein diacylglyceryl transferase
VIAAYIPSPSANGIHIGPFFLHVYGLMYVLAVAGAILVSSRRWKKAGGDPNLPYEVALWAFPAGLIGGRIYFLITTPSQVPDHWWGPFAIWQGGLGIWGGIAGGVLVGLLVVRRRLSKPDVRRFMDAAAPGLLVAQSFGRVGNYFNQELFGKPSTLPWALKISPSHRPPGYLQYATFQPTFLYEIIWNLSLAAFLVWLGHHRKIRPPGLFALYVAGYSAFRLFEEQLRIDYSVHILGMRLNFWIALILFLIGVTWFIATQRGVTFETIRGKLGFAPVIKSSAADGRAPAPRATADRKSLAALRAPLHGRRAPRRPRTRD